MTTEAIGSVHPDVLWGYQQGQYAGPGWAQFLKALPIETLTLQGGSSMTNLNDRTGTFLDPEDPRHPIALMQFGAMSHMDGAFHQLTYGDFGTIPKGSRLLQVLYENYLEPFSMNRVCAQLYFYQKVPNNYHESVNASAEYVGQTASLVGQVIVGVGACIMEGVTIRADTNCVYLAEGVQILENTCIMSDAPTDLLAYQRHELLNPYQQWDGMDGVTRIMPNTIVESNCYLDSCSIGSFNRIGHNTKIMKGVTTGIMVHILPGSVVTADTKIGDGEIWGGAPARKVGDVSKFEYKRPYYPSLLHKESVAESYRNMSRYGDQVVHRANAMGKLESLMIHYEDHITPSVKAQVRDFAEGREPFHHMLTRISQGWSPANRPDDKNFALAAPAAGVKLFAEHNTDSFDSDFHGTYMNITNIFNDFRW
jgi:carbonic anhydrase/acetyltransferase-like protein (isoleucine patch superfamily)